MTWFEPAVAVSCAGVPGIVNGFVQIMRGVSIPREVIGVIRKQYSWPFVRPLITFEAFDV